MRVLIIESAGNLWGSERALLDLIDGIPNWECGVCCPPDTLLGTELQRRNIQVLPWFVANLHLKSKAARLKAAFGILRACLNFRPHVIHLNQSGAFKVASLAANLLNLPIVAHVRIFEDAAYLAQQPLIFSRLISIIAISQAIKAEIRQFPALEKLGLHQIYDAYSPSLSQLQPTESHQRDRTNTVVCVGRVSPIKGQAILLGALKLMNRDVECRIVGEGEPALMRELKSASTDIAGLQWDGFVRNVIPILQRSTVMVCPSLREPLGRVIFEAWDAGCVPVVYAGSGGAAEIIAASGGGITYAEQTPKSLAIALEQALSLKPAQRRHLVQSGRIWMSENCNPQSYGEKVSAVLYAACK
jgi:glycosyltransferase involved in cell wall biosynthesis